MPFLIRQSTFAGGSRRQLSDRLKGYLSIFVAASFWGSSATAAKFLFQHDVTPLLVIESRVIVAAAILLIYFSVRNRKMLRLDLRDLGGFALLGIIGVAGANFTYYMAIQKTDVAIAILMQYTAPVLVAIYVLITRVERISVAKTVAIILALTGCSIMLGLFDSHVHIRFTGAVLGMLSAICFAFFNVYAKTALKKYSVWTGLTFTFTTAAVFWILFNFLTRSEFSISGPGELGALTIFSLTSVLVPYYFFFVGLKYLLPSTAVIVSNLEPVVAISTAYLFLGERLRILQVAGGLLIISAVILLELKRE